MCNTAFEESQAVCAKIRCGIFTGEQAFLSKYPHESPMREEIEELVKPGKSIWSANCRLRFMIQCVMINLFTSRSVLPLRFACPEAGVI